MCQVGPWGPRLYPGESLNSGLGGRHHASARAKEAEAERPGNVSKVSGSRIYTQAWLQAVDPESHTTDGRVPVRARTHVFPTLVGQRSQERGSISPESSIEDIQNVPHPLHLASSVLCREAQALTSDSLDSSCHLKAVT